ncbi:MAG: hypothetical protein JWO05_1059 [Gemmatimonadetes bacterium]|nr:hypothetical protein [Gemmatimonadota bacterium]
MTARGSSSALFDAGAPLLAPTTLWSRNEILVQHCPVPKLPGVYAWYFREAPAGVPVDGCIRVRDLTLLYVGISPKRAPTNGKPPSGQRLWHRIRYHLRGNAAGSTLRLTLGCLLAEELRIELRRVGSGSRYTFAEGEATLTDWMARNARVTWVEHPEPWKLESELIESLILPLNLSENKRHPFHASLSATRRLAREKADRLPIVSSRSSIRRRA